MKGKQYSFSINKPCHEDWSAMSTTEQGKFCASCAKNVIDLTRLTDAEIIRILQNSKGNICGRAKATQLNRVLTPPVPKPIFTPYYKALAASALVLAGVETVVATDTTTKTETVAEVKSITDEEDKKTEEIIPNESIPFVIKGRVIDAKTGETLIGSSVVLKNTATGTITDIDGNFTISIPNELMKDTLVFVVSFTGFKATEFTVLKASFNNKNNLLLQKEIKLQVHATTGLMVITGGISSRESDENIAPPEMLYNFLFH